MKKLTILFLSIICLGQFSFSQEIDTKKYCKQIKTQVDKFEGETKYTTPLLKQISFIKIIHGENELNYMMISTIGLTPATGEGVILLLENGEKVIFNNVKTEVNVNSSAQFEHSAFITLTKDNIELLKKYNITDARLYIFDMKIKDPIQYRAYLMCLDEMK